MHLRLNWSRITFAGKIFFQVSSLLRFRKNAMDTLNVRTARWVIKVAWHGGNSGQHPFVHRQTDLFPGPLRVLFVKTVKRPLFLSPIQNYYRTIQPKFPVQNQIYGQPVVLFPRNLEIPGIFRSIGHSQTEDINQLNIFCSIQTLKNHCDCSNKKRS